MALAKRLFAVAVSAAFPAGVIYAFGTASGGYMAGPISGMVAAVSVPITVLASFGWHELARRTLGPSNSSGATGFDLVKAVGWVFGVSLVAGVGFEFMESSWGILGFIIFTTSGVSYLLLYHFLLMGLR